MFHLLNSNKLFFYIILIFSVMISISSNSWFGCWIGLEMNLLSFIPIICKSNNLFASEASLKYFIIQSIASMNFLFSILMMMFLFQIFKTNNIISMLINTSLLMKMGSAPFHFWFPIITEGLNWMNCFIMMSWQKITPMILLSYYFNINFLILIMILNTIFGSVGGLNQTSLRKMMAFSSINNLGWMIAAIMISENLWMMYFGIYTLMIAIMFFMFFMMNFFFMNQIFNTNVNYMIKFSMIVNMLSLGGLPPFLGFFPKWIIINFMINNNMIMLVFFFIMTSLITLCYYIKISFSAIMMNYFKMKWSKMFMKNYFLMIVNFMSYISIMGIIILNSMFFF